ncbi:uncharacterized protein [Macrobrachium rosenbergii]|uniref:uncharacterized protein n=1 Tax=Macrobrachium rosenbergii TaxID=79674 RepID=UPI0034D54846
MAAEHYKTFLGLGTAAGLTGSELTTWVKEQVDDLAKREKEERLEQRKYEAEQRKYEEERRVYEAEQRQYEEEREERRRQHELACKETELALKEKELELERAKMENAEAMASHQASSPTPAASNAPISSINSLVPKWTEDEPEAWLEEIEALFDNYSTTETERALILAKHMEGKAKAALRSLEKSQRGNMAEVRRVITKAYEITPEKWRQRFRGLAKEVGWSWTEWACHKTQSGTRWFDSLACTTFEDLFNRTMLEDLFQCVPGPLAVYLNDKQPSTLMEACRMADSWKPSISRIAPLRSESSLRPTSRTPLARRMDCLARPCATIARRGAMLKLSADTNSALISSLTLPARTPLPIHPLSPLLQQLLQATEPIQKARANPVGLLATTMLDLRPVHIMSPPPNLST